MNDTFRFREGDMVTLGDRRGKVIGFTLAGGVYVQFQDAKAPALCQRWGLVVHERGPWKDATEEKPDTTEATAVCRVNQEFNPKYCLTHQSTWPEGEPHCCNATVERPSATDATLVDRLRSFAQEQFDDGKREVWRALTDAADEIERLREELTETNRKSLDFIQNERAGMQVVIDDLRQQLSDEQYGRAVL